MMASKGWKVIQPHIPMIKFRKGGVNRATGGTASSVKAPSAAAGASARGTTGPQVIALPTIEDIYLPARFQRRPLEQREIEYINRGGPE